MWYNNNDRAPCDPALSVLIKRSKENAQKPYMISSEEKGYQQPSCLDSKKYSMKKEKKPHVRHPKRLI